MDTNVKALKNLYEQLGGNPADVANISTNAEMIDAIAGLDIGGGGGGSGTTIDVLYSGERNTSGTSNFTPEHPYTDYDLVVVNIGTDVSVATNVFIASMIGAVKQTYYSTDDGNSCSASIGSVINRFSVTVAEGYSFTAKVSIVGIKY